MKKTLCAVLAVVSAAVLIYSLTNIIRTEKDYRKAEEIYEKSRSESFHISESIPEAHVSNMTEEYFPYVSVDFVTLEATNPDVIGWLWIPDTEISFPLLRGGDNHKYLSLSYDLQRTNSGSIFMDFRNSESFSDGNTIIYGHNMKSGGMFGTLKDYADTGFLAEHPYLYIFTEDCVYKYHVFAAYITEADSPSFIRTFSEEFGFEDFLAYVKACAGETFSNQPEESVPVVTLSTCTSGRRSERFVVHACLAATKNADSAVPGEAA